jgi:hypothetical protein
VGKETKKRKVIEERKAEREKNVFCNGTKQKRYSQCRQKQINFEINTFEIKGNLKMEPKTFEQQVVRHKRLNRIKCSTIVELIIEVNFVTDKM